VTRGLVRNEPDLGAVEEGPLLRVCEPARVQFVKHGLGLVITTVFLLSEHRLVRGCLLLMRHYDERGRPVLLARACLRRRRQNLLLVHLPNQLVILCRVTLYLNLLPQVLNLPTLRLGLLRGMRRRLQCCCPRGRQKGRILLLVQGNRRLLGLVLGLLATLALISLLHAAILRTGFRNHPQLLARQALVIYLLVGGLVLRVTHCQRIVVDEVAAWVVLPRLLMRVVAKVVGKKARRLLLRRGLSGGRRNRDGVHTRFFGCRHSGVIGLLRLLGVSRGQKFAVSLRARRFLLLRVPSIQIVGVRKVRQS